jgi:hypothetical protein
MLECLLGYGNKSHESAALPVCDCHPAVAELEIPALVLPIEIGALVRDPLGRDAVALDLEGGYVAMLGFDVLPEVNGPDERRTGTVDGDGLGVRSRRLYVA